MVPIYWHKNSEEKFYVATQLLTEFYCSEVMHTSGMLMGFYFTLYNIFVIKTK